MNKWMRFLHKWLGLVLGLQFVLWMGSGLLMSVLDANAVHGHQYRAHAVPDRPWPADAVDAGTALAHGGAVNALSTAWVLDRPVYRLAGDGGTRLVDARSGAPFAIDAALARRLAVASYSGGAHAGAARLMAKSPETRSHKEAVWRVDFADAAETSVYVSAQTGAVLEHRNSSWRLFDIAWMLHIMDYAGRKDFNHPLVVTSAIGALLLSLGGTWLTIVCLRVSLRRRTRRVAA